ncbi:hypothetical protein EGW08_020592, partial [Elysia chlorotica]
YKPEVRPTTAGEATYVYVGIYLLSIQNLDEKSQVLETAIIVDAEWVDDYLAWNASDYGGVGSFLYPQKKVWLPDIVIENSVESQRELGYDQNLVYIESSGLVNWKPSQVVKTGCDIDVTYYPFDTQTCNIIVSTWMSKSTDIDIDPESGSSGLILDRYSVSGTWELIANELQTLPTDKGLTRIQFKIKLKRLRTFYILNIILPVLFLSFTASMVFFLPADAGEKIGMGITVLLAYAVYLTIIADNMPQTSLQVSYLAVYLTLLLGLTAMGVVLAVVVLHIHHKPDDCTIGERTERMTRKLRVLLRINRTSSEPEREPEDGPATKRKAVGERLTTAGSHATSVNVVTPLNNNANSSPPPSYKESKEEITWPKVAETMDRVMFFITKIKAKRTNLLQNHSQVIGCPTMSRSLTLTIAAVLLLSSGLFDLHGRGRLGVALVDAVTQADRYNLMNFLFTGYKPEVRPTRTGEATYVYVGIYLLSIQNLDEKSQVLETSIVVEADWDDEYLSWNASDYGGVDYFLYPQSNVWLPDIVIENSVETQGKLGYDENLVVIQDSGLINWKPSQVVKTGCDIDVTYYPFDTQTCNIIVSTWMSTSTDIDIDPESGSSGLILDRYSASGTWELVSNKLEILPAVKGLTRIQFQIKLRRLRTYYIVNIILPVLFLSFTASMVFFLPADAGEKIGMGITVLLAYAVYLTIIADNMPQTSLQVSYLAVYLTLLLGLTAMGVVLAVVVLHIHHK